MSATSQLGLRTSTPLHLEWRCWGAKAHCALYTLAGLSCQLELLSCRHDPLLGAGTNEQWLRFTCTVKNCSS